MEFNEAKAKRTHECDDSSLQAKLVMEASFIGQTAMKGLDASRDELTKACADGSIVPQFAQTAAIGAGLAWMANSRLKLVGQGLTAVMGTQFVMDIAKSAGEVFGKSIDTWNNPENYQSNLKAASTSAGHFIYENALGAFGVPTGAVLGHAASKIHFNGFGHGQLMPAHATASAKHESGTGIAQSHSIDYSMGRDKMEFIEAKKPEFHELKTKDGEVLFSGNFFSLKDALETAVKENVSLEGVHLPLDCDIRGANLTGANIEHANFFFAQADGVNFSGARAKGADFTRMRAAGANFSGMQAEKATFESMQAVGADFSDMQASGASFRRADAKRASFRGMQAREADFFKMAAEGANFNNMKAEDANFQSMQAVGADFSSAQVDRAIFYSMHATKANFSGIQAKGADCRQMEAEHADFTLANFENAVFTNVNAAKADFTDANFDNAEICFTNFRDANLSGVCVGQIEDLELAKLELSQIDWDVNVPPVDWRPTETMPEDYYGS